MFKSAIWYSSLIFSLLRKQFAAIKAKRLLNKEDKSEFNAFVYHEVSVWAKHRLYSTGSKINVNGLENLPKDETVLFVSNHQSNFDIPLLLAELPVPKGFIAKKELSNVPILSKWMRYINCLFMDRDDLKQSMQVILEGIKLLKGGYSMVVFPEGTRSKGGPAGEFKAGSFKLALKSKVKIVPITIDGTYKILEQNNYKIKPAEVSLYIHPPIETTNLTKDEIADLPQRVEKIILSKLTTK